MPVLKFVAVDFITVGTSLPIGASAVAGTDRYSQLLPP